MVHIRLETESGGCIPLAMSNGECITVNIMQGSNMNWEANNDVKHKQLQIGKESSARKPTSEK